MSLEAHPGFSPPDEVTLSLPEDRTGISRTLLLANALVFASSTCIMVLEIVAARLIAANLGASLYTWTTPEGHSALTRPAEPRTSMKSSPSTTF